MYFHDNYTFINLFYTSESTQVERQSIVCHCGLEESARRSSDKVFRNGLSSLKKLTHFLTSRSCNIFEQLMSIRDV